MIASAAVAPSTFLQGSAKGLLVVHALVAVAAGGACTHLAIVILRLWRAQRSPDLALPPGREQHLGRLARVYSTVIGGVYLGAFALGLLMYPTYRYAVRGIYLDRYAQWASNLFDIKENLAALGLPLALALFVVGRRWNPQVEPELCSTLAFLSAAVWLVVISSVVMGLLVTSVRGV